MHLFYSTFNNQEEALKIAEGLLNKSHIKCCNVLNKNATSIYKWKGSVEKETETLALFKIADGKREKFIQELEKIHPYDTPCIIEIKTDFINPSYEKWINEDT